MAASIAPTKLLYIGKIHCATSILRLFPCLMAKVGKVAKKGKIDNRKSQKKIVNIFLNKKKFSIPFLATFASHALW